jgi:hypothetical protein
MRATRELNSHLRTSFVMTSVVWVQILMRMVFANPRRGREEVWTRAKADGKVTTEGLELDTV